MTPLEVDTLLLFGLDHRSAGIEVREAVAKDAVARAQGRVALAHRAGIRSSVWMSTCNRTEVYGALPKAAAGGFDAASMTEIVFPSLNGAPAPYLYRGQDAVMHLFRVSSGLDSMVLGESEILGQVKDAFEEALVDGVESRILHDLFRQAIAVGKRVRTETRIGEGSLSVASTAVKLARKVVGRVDDKTALIVGAGETGVLAARHLMAAGIAEMIVVNRTRARADELARELGAVAGGLDDLARHLEAADVVIVCVAAEAPVILPAHVERLNPRTRCIIDISVPRAVHPAVASQAGVFLLNLDDVQKLVDGSQQERVQSIQVADDIVVAEVHKFLSLQAYAGLSPLVRGLKESFERVTGAHIDAEALGEGDAARASRLSSRLLGTTLESLKLLTRERRSIDDVRAAYRSFIEKRP